MVGEQHQKPHLLKGNMPQAEDPRPEEDMGIMIKIGEVSATLKSIKIKVVCAMSLTVVISGLQDPNYVEYLELVDSFPFFLNRLNVVPFL